jgi:TRAP-type C4-dicarboxylate transport system substrate-binding protein
MVPRRAVLERGLVVAGAAWLGMPMATAAAADAFILAHGFGTDHFVHPAGTQFTEQLARLSGGALTVEFHPGGDLGDYIQQFEQTMQGGIQMTLAGPATDLDARLNVSYLAYIADDWTRARELYGPGGQMVTVLDGVARDLGLKLLGMVPGGFGNIAVRKGVDRRPVSFPADAAGFKMRVPPFEIGVRRFEAWGFSPVPIPYSELYTALQLGTVDGRSFGPPTEIWEMRDAIGAYILTRDYFDTAFWIANLDWWEALEAQHRTWIETAANDAIAASWQQGEENERKQLEQIKAFGIEVVPLPADAMNAAKAIVYDKEWPWMETVVGAEFMAAVRKAAGLDP